MARLTLETDIYADTGSPLCVVQDRAGWGRAPNTVNNDNNRFQIAARAGGRPLTAVYIANKSQADKVLLSYGTPGVGSEAFLCGVKRPFFVPDRNVDAPLTVTPWQVYNNNDGGSTITSITPFHFDSANYNTIYAGAMKYWGIADSVASVALIDVNAHMGAFLALEAWYGDYPKVYHPYRDDWDIAGQIKVNTSTNTWRNIVAGRREWIIDTIENSGISTLAWEIFGVNESWRGDQSTRRRTSLLSGTGNIAASGVNKYDIIEVDFSDSAAGSGYNLPMRFTARD